MIPACGKLPDTQDKIERIRSAKDKLDGNGKNRGQTSESE